MSKFFKFVSANLRLAGNLMISPSERFHAGQLASTVSGLAFEGLRGVTEVLDAATPVVSKKARKSKSIWAKLSSALDLSESVKFDSFGYMVAPSERTSLATSLITRAPEAQAQAKAPAEKALAEAAAPAKAEAKRPSLWANFALMVGPNALTSPVAMRELANSPVITKLREEAHAAEVKAAEAQAAAPMSHQRLADLLAQSWLNPAEYLVRLPESKAVPAAQAAAADVAEEAKASDMSHERLSGLLAQTWLEPAEHLVGMPQFADKAPATAPAAAPVAEVAVAPAQSAERAESASMSHERLSGLLAQTWLEPAEHLVGMPQFAQETHVAPAAQTAPAAEAVKASAMSHERLSGLLAQTWLEPAEHLVGMPQFADKAPAAHSELSLMQKVWLNLVSPSERLVRAQLGDQAIAPALVAASGRPSVAHARLADLLAQCSLNPTQRLVDSQVAAPAPEVQAESLSSYAVATLTEQPALSAEELTSLYLKRFAWLDPTQSMLMAHLAQALQQSDNEVKAEPETTAYVAARWDGIVAALTEDTPQAIATLPHKAPQRGLIAAFKRMTVSESKLIAAQVSAGRRLPHLN